MGRLNNHKNANRANSNVKNFLDSSLVGQDSDSVLSLDWSQLITSVNSSNVDSVLESLMNKIATTENVQFDQVSLVLQHHLQNEQVLQKFLEKGCINALVERLSRSATWSSSVEWMITEIFKSVSSLCNPQQESQLLTESFFNLIFKHTMSLKADSLTNVSATEAATFKNVLDTASNFCEKKEDLAKFVPVNWIHECVINTSNHPELCAALGNLLFTISEKPAVNCDLNLYQQSINYLAPFIATNSNFNLAVLYIIGSLTKMILKQNNSNKNFDLLRVVKEYGRVFYQTLDYVVNYHGNRSENQDEDQNNNDDLRLVIKNIEVLVESKLVTIDIIQSIFSEFIPESANDNENIEDEWEDVESGDEGDIEMETDNKIESDEPVANTQRAELSQELKALLNETKLIDVLLVTIINDNENLFLDTDQVDFISNSIRLTKIEACSAYLLLNQHLKDKSQSYIEQKEEHLAKTLHYLAELKELSSNEDLRKGYLKAVSSLCFEIAQDCYKALKSEDRELVVLAASKLLDKHQIKYEDACVNFCRLILIIAVDERDKVPQNKDLIMRVAVLFMKLATIALVQVETNNVRVAAEMLDCIIDLFSEDNLKDVENQLHLVNKMKEFHEKYMQMIKRIGKKINKNESAVVKTVRDNLKPFIDYKIRH